LPFSCFMPQHCQSRSAEANDFSCMQRRVADAVDYGAE